MVLLLCSLSGCLLYTNIAALLPQFVEENHPDFSSLSIGILFASYQISFVGAAPWVGNHLHEFGRKRALFWSFIIITFASFAFAAAGWIENDYGFYAVSITARFAQGLGESVFFIVCPSILAIEYPDKLEVYIGYTQTLSALGYMLGPAIAAILYRWFDYIAIQFIFGFIVLLVGVFTIVVIPDRIDRADCEEGDEKTVNVPYREFLKNPRAMMACLMYFLTACGFCFYEPILSIRLYEIGVAEENVAVGFILTSATYAIGSIVIGLVSEKVDKRAVIFVSFLFFSFSIYLSGGLASESISVSLIGLALAGFFQAGGIIPIIPECIEVMQK